jgi:protein TonB
MFQDVMFVPERHVGARAAAWPIAVLAHAIVALLLVAIPLLRVGELPSPDFTGIFLAPPRGRPEAAHRVERITPVRQQAVFDPAKLISPVSIPASIGEEPLDLGGWEVGIPGGVDYGDDSPFARNATGLPANWLVVGGGEDDAAPLRASGDVKPPRLIKRVEPDYPEIARLSRVQGVVILEATTDVYGRVASLRILRSIPLLDQAAVDAVRQWVYEPLIVNGRPRAVTFTVTIRFELH